MCMYWIATLCTQSQISQGSTSGSTLYHTFRVDDLRKFCPTESHHAVADGVVPLGAGDFTRVEARFSEGSDVLSAVPKEVDV